MITTTTYLRTATGETASTFGEIVVNFKLGSQNFSHQVLVANISDDVILGMDIMKEYGFSLDLKEGLLRVRNEDLVFHCRSEATVRVILEKEETLPPRSKRWS